MRRDRLDAFGDCEAGRVGENHEGGNAACAGRFAGAGKDGVDVGNAAVRDPGFLAIEHEVITVAASCTGHRRHIRSRLGFGKRKGGNPLAAGDLLQNRPLQRLGAGKADRAGAEPLHGEGEVGKAVGIGKGLANEAERAAVDVFAHAAEGFRHAMAKHACAAQRCDQMFAGGIGVCMINSAEAATGYEVIQLSGKRAVAVVVERPVEMVACRRAQNRIMGTHA